MPAFVEQADSLLNGEPLEGDGAMTRVEEVEIAASAAEAWVTQLALLNTLRKQASSARAELEKGSVDRDRWEDTLKTADEKLSEARQEMFNAASIEKLLESEIPNDLKEGRRALDQIADLWRKHFAATSIAMAGGLGLAEGGSLLQRVLESARPPSEMAKTAARKRRILNIVVGAALALTTLWTGLTNLYFDEAWGTGRDYLTALTWGATVEGTLIALAAAADRLRVRKSLGS